MRRPGAPFALVPASDRTSPSSDPHQRGLAGAIRADQRDDLLGRDGQMDVIEDVAPIARQMNVVEPQQPVRAGLGLAM